MTASLHKNTTVNIVDQKLKEFIRDREKMINKKLYSSPQTLEKQIKEILTRDEDVIIKDEDANEKGEVKISEVITKQKIINLLSLIKTVGKAIIKDDEPKEKESCRVVNSHTGNVESQEFKWDKEAILRNNLRASQRLALEDIISGKQQL